MIQDKALYLLPVQNVTDIPVEIDNYVFGQNDPLSAVDDVEGMEYGIDANGNPCVYIMLPFGSPITAIFKYAGGNTYTSSAILSPRPRPTRPH